MLFNFCNPKSWKFSYCQSEWAEKWLILFTFRGQLHEFIYLPWKLMYLCQRHSFLWQMFAIEKVFYNLNNYSFAFSNGESRKFGYSPKILEKNSLDFPLEVLSRRLVILILFKSINNKTFHKYFFLFRKNQNWKSYKSYMTFENCFKWWTLTSHSNHQFWIFNNFIFLHRF